MQCLRCHQDNPSQAKFCLECGTPFTPTRETGPRGLTYADLQDALTESLEQQTATGEILRVIASSPTDIQPVLDVVATSAARFCGATDAAILRLGGESLRLVATHGPRPSNLPIGATIAASRGAVVGRAVCDRQTIHIEDLLALPPAEFSETRARTLSSQAPTRTVLATPLLRDGVPIGVIGLRRVEVHPFSAKQIALLETFANQAVIAIENVRLFQELQVKNRDLTERLEQQTATADVLRVISRSPTDVHRLPEFVAGFLRDGVDVIVTTSTRETQAAKQATCTVPIVMTLSPDPVAQRLVASLARPGGNVTGVTNLVPGISQKYVELLREIAPSASRFVVLTCRRGPFRKFAKISNSKHGDSASRCLTRALRLRLTSRKPSRKQRTMAWAASSFRST